MFFASQYDRLEDESDSQEEVHNSRPKRLCAPAIILSLSLAFALFTGMVGFWTGLHAGKPAVPNWLAPAGTIDHTFIYRKQFASRPTNDTEHTWEVMFPRGRGFVQHPTVSPTVMGMAVFHQLHCLDALRKGYYMALDGVEPSLPHLHPGHIRHCIDYLRQSLMCAADTNLEPIDPKVGGVTGFKYPRKCRDIVRIIGWADKWRTHNQSTIL